MRPPIRVTFMDLTNVEACMSSSTFEFDSALTATVDDLQSRTGVQSRGEVIRRAVALLKVVSQAHDNGEAVVLRQTAADGTVTEREIILP